ncbi:hypothetical protein [Modicisalibacter xianhensis]|uniref:ElaB/YqjD/DUF883 family membrane-anchored ribosome-binding protein n=1 Tax=Modicisalibacter xianhensis TaxID=442341 RepID=A0A1I3CAD0_9GAMM|nr:hypothetical protein [Halomonas xianhensis]SFH71129.1 hypothetical protein SAMN04487959_10881 [Halomonas xianhensis]
MVDPEKRVNPNLPAYDNGADGGSGPTASGGESSQRDELKQRGRETAHEIKGAARQQAEGLFSQQRDAAADQAEKISSAFRKMADEFDDQEQPLFSGYANDVASCTDNLSQRLREKDLGGLIEQAQDYSRRQPALYFGGAVAAGFLLARFLRSSNERQTQQRYQQSTSQPGGYDTTPY